MQIYLPTGQYFKDRKEAKKFFGERKYRRLLKDKLIRITDYVAPDELQKNNQQDSGTQS